MEFCETWRVQIHIYLDPLEGRSGRRFRALSGSPSNYCPNTIPWGSDYDKSPPTPNSDSYGPCIAAKICKVNIVTVFRFSPANLLRGKEPNTTSGLGLGGLGFRVYRGFRSGVYVNACTSQISDPNAASEYKVETMKTETKPSSPMSTSRHVDIWRALV